MRNYLLPCSQEQSVKGFLMGWDVEVQISSRRIKSREGFLLRGNQVRGNFDIVWRF